MKGKSACFLAVFAMLILALPASAAGGGDASGQWGLLFNAKNLLYLDGFEDGYQAGAGVKYWVRPTIAARALLGVDHNTDKAGDLSTTTVGLGLAGEWHPKRGDVSPYFGPLLGTRVLAQTGQTTRADFYFGGLFGAEVKLFGPIWAFAEYDLVASFDVNGFTLTLGTNGSGGGQALIGLAVYF
jgi:hypothetical protein